MYVQFFSGLIKRYIQWTGGWFNPGKLMQGLGTMGHIRKMGPEASRVVIHILLNENEELRKCINEVQSVLECFLHNKEGKIFP